MRRYIDITDIEIPSDENDYDELVAFADAIASQEVIELPSTQQWIACSERPPEVGTTVFITKKPFKINGYEEEVVKAKRSVDPRSGEIKWWSPEFGTLTDKVVLAWMPMPEPYRGESK